MCIHFRQNIFSYEFRNFPICFNKTKNTQSKIQKKKCVHFVLNAIKVLILYLILNLVSYTLELYRMQANRIEYGSKYLLYHSL